MNMVTKVQILNKAICISHSANTLGKGMNATILLLVIGEQSEFFNHGIAMAIREGKLWI